MSTQKHLKVIFQQVLDLPLKHLQPVLQLGGLYS